MPALQKILIKYHPVPSIVSGLFIFILCFLPGSVIPVVTWATAFQPDKWVHIILYFLWIKIFIFSGGKQVVFIGIIMILIGGNIELFQHYLLSDRSGEWLDWLADGVGVIGGILLKRNKSK